MLFAGLLITVDVLVAVLLVVSAWGVLVFLVLVFFVLVWALAPNMQLNIITVNKNDRFKICFTFSCFIDCSFEKLKIGKSTL